MKILRWILAACLALWGLWNLMPIVMTAGYKYAHMKVPADVARLTPLFEATTWWQLVLWMIVVVLFLATAWRLIRRQRAILVFAACFLLDVVNFLIMKAQPVYDQVFSKSELQVDYEIFALLIIAGGLIWWIERRDRAA